MKKGKLLVVCLALGCAPPLAAVAQMPPSPSGIRPDEDAPQPAAPVFTPPMEHPEDPFGGPIAPLAPLRVAAPPVEGEAVEVNAFRVQLTDSSQIVGQLLLDAPLTVKTKYGEMKLTAEDIARIDTGVDEGQWRFTLTGGDRVTGTVKLTGLKLKTSWGEVKLDEKNIAALEEGKLRTQQFAIARTSPDGRTRSMMYRTRQIFVPAAAVYDNSSTGYHPTTPAYVPSTTFTTPVVNEPAMAPPPALRPR